MVQIFHGPLQVDYTEGPYDSEAVFFWAGSLGRGASVTGKSSEFRLFFMIQVDQSKAGGLISKGLDTPSASIPAGGHAYFRTVNDSDVGIFWVLQFLGWSGISLLTYLSLSLPYAQFELTYLAHNLAQSVLGFCLTSLMRLGFRGVWLWPTGPRLAIVLLSVFFFAALWSVLRLLLFMVMTGETNLWSDFGGWVFPSIFVFLAWAALYHGIKYYRLQQQEHARLVRFETRQRQEALKLSQAESAVREAQLKLLRYQLNPHFLFNTLNSISALMASERSSDAQKMLLNLSTFLRFSLEGERSITVPLHEEIQAARLYLAIEQVRFADRMTVEFRVDDGALRSQVPSLLLQPLIENAIKYAVSQSESGGVIRITANLVKELLCVDVEDSGPNPGIHRAVSAKERESVGAGIGLANTRARLETIYGDEFSLRTMRSELGGLCVRLSLPELATAGSQTE